MLWVDKHRPTSLAKMDYHEDLTARLQALVSVATKACLMMMMMMVMMTMMIECHGTG